MIGRLERRAGYTILTAGTLIAALPLVGVVLMALNSPSNAEGSLSITSATHLGNFGTVWRMAGFGQSLRASAIITVSTVVISLIVSVPAGYALATMRFRGRSVLFYLLLLGLLVPLEAMIVPLYFDMRRFGLADNYWSVILPDSALSVAFGSFWMRAFFLSTPRSLIEAARLDGAGVLTTLRRVLLPLARPQMLTLAVLVFVWTWNDFLLPLVMLSGSDIQTAPISLVFFQSQHTTNYTYLAAAAIITVLPVVLVYVLLQRSFTRGMLSGALKG
jgi:raffinose/stachyose/melibiose transport system permease protein